MQEKLSKPSLALIFAACTVLFWSTAATAFKLSLAHIGFMPLVFYASLLSMLVLGGLCCATKQIGMLRTWKPNDYVRSVLLGGINPALYYLVLLRAYELLPAQEALVLNFSWPIVLMILGVIFLKQNLSWASLLAILLSFVGVMIIATRGNINSLGFTNPVGVILALSSTLMWAVYWLGNQGDDKPALLRLWINFIAGVAWLALIMSLTGSWVLPSHHALLGSAYIGLFEMSLGFYCWLQALRLANNVSVVNNVIFLTPFFSIMLISLVLNEAIYPTTIAGLLLICASILFQRLMLNRQTS